MTLTMAVSTAMASSNDGVNNQGIIAEPKPTGAVTTTSGDITISEDKESVVGDQEIGGSRVSLVDDEDGSQDQLIISPEPRQQQKEIEEAEEMHGSIELVPCSMCGRKFLPDRLPRHAQACVKTTTKKRRVFESHKQRSTDELLANGPGGPGAKIGKGIRGGGGKAAAAAAAAAQSETKKKSNWREKHEEFLRTVRAARGEKVETPPQTADGGGAVPFGFVECPTCGRRFNEHVAERHIPWCQERQRQMPRTPNSNEALSRHKMRMKYKPSNTLKKAETTTTTTMSTTISNRRTSDSRMISSSDSLASNKSSNMSKMNGSGTRAAAAAARTTIASRGTVASNNKRSMQSRAISEQNIAQKSRNTPESRSVSPPRKRVGGGGGAPSRQGAPVPRPRQTLNRTATSNYYDNHPQLRSPTKNPPNAKVMKFKEKFPNHPSKNGQDVQYTAQVKELLRRTSENHYDPSPKTVPGVRTGGMSPTKPPDPHVMSLNSGGGSRMSNYGSQHCSPVGLRGEFSVKSNPGSMNGGLDMINGGPYDGYGNGRPLPVASSLDDLAALKSRIDEIYQLNGTVGGVNGQNQTDSGNPIPSSSGSSDSSSIPTLSRGNSGSETASRASGTDSRAGMVNGINSTNQNGGLPRFCHQCGTKYPVTIAKYCYECGARRLGTVGPFLA